MLEIGHVNVLPAFSEGLWFECMHDPIALVKRVSCFQLYNILCTPVFSTNRNFPLTLCRPETADRKTLRGQKLRL